MATCHCAATRGTRAHLDQPAGRRVAQQVQIGEEFLLGTIF
jgi:hypothetical protein